MFKKIFIITGESSGDKIGSLVIKKLKLIEELMQRLERLRPEKVLERKGNEAENLNKALKYRPMQSPFNVI